VDVCLTRVSGHAERLAALELIAGYADRPVAITLGADKGYDAADFVEAHSSFPFSAVSAP
jgi:hypothetical protein